MPNPKLTMMTSILASVLFKVETNSAKTTAPLTEIQRCFNLQSWTIKLPRPVGSKSSRLYYHGDADINTKITIAPSVDKG